MTGVDYATRHFPDVAQPARVPPALGGKRTYECLVWLGRCLIQSGHHTSLALQALVMFSSSNAARPMVPRSCIRASSSLRSRVR